jgi:hypothetical protein
MVTYKLSWHRNHVFALLETAMTQLYLHNTRICLATTCRNMKVHQTGVWQVIVIQSTRKYTVQDKNVKGVGVGDPP